MVSIIVKTGKMKEIVPPRLVNPGSGHVVTVNVFLSTRNVTTSKIVKMEVMRSWIVVIIFWMFDVLKSQISK